MPRSSRKESRPAVADLLFGAGQSQKKKEKKVKKNRYIDFCKLAHKYVGKSAKKELTEQYKVTLAFLGWKLKPEELNSAPLFAMYVGIGFAFVWAFLNYAISMFIGPIGFGDFTIIGHPLTFDMGMLWYLGPFGLAMFAMYYVQSYPLKAAEKLRIKSLTFIPEITNYLVMAMKVTPNLERAIKFVAEHGHGRISRDFKTLAYDIHVGKYRTVEEALDYIAWKWGEYSDEFKHALMLIRSSVMEADQFKRDALLDKAVEDVLSGIQEKMDMYSRAMHQPSIYLYYFGVLLPLLLIIIIPVGAMMGGEQIGFLAGAAPLFIIYNILIPAIAFLLAKSILGSRPPTREVPKVPKDLPGLPKPGWFKIGGNQLPVIWVCGMIFALVFGVSFLPSVIFPDQFGVPPSFDPAYDSYCLIGSPDALCIPMIQYIGFFLGVVYAVAFYIWAMNKDRRKVQLEIVKMENEFQDTLYILASRLGEGRPMEDALKYASEFLPKSPATKRIFLPTLQNVTMLGMTIDKALFDEAYGSLRYIPSGFIHGTMRIVVDSLGLGVQTAARSLVSLSMQLRDSQKVEKALKAMLEDITNMMSTMSIFIAPVVLGITISLQQIIMGAMRSMAEAGLTDKMDAPTGASGVTAFKAPSLGDPAVLDAAASQAELLLIISIYMIEIVVILVYFAAHVNEGDNDLAFKMALAQALPIAMTIFFGVTYGAMMVIGSLGGF